jgi:two-component system, response regulator
VVLLDIKLPKVDGLEVLAELKQHPDTRHVPVVMLTSSP